MLTLMLAPGESVQLRGELDAELSIVAMALVPAAISGMVPVLLMLPEQAPLLFFVGIDPVELVPGLRVNLAPTRGRRGGRRRPLAFDGLAWRIEKGARCG